MKIRKIDDKEVIAKLRVLYGERDELDKDIADLRCRVKAAVDIRAQVQEAIDSMIRPLPIFDE